MYLLKKYIVMHKNGAQSNKNFLKEKLGSPTSRYLQAGWAETCCGRLAAKQLKYLFGKNTRLQQFFKKKVRPLLLSEKSVHNLNADHSPQLKAQNIHLNSNLQLKLSKKASFFIY